MLVRNTVDAPVRGGGAKCGTKGEYKVVDHGHDPASAD